MTNSTRGNHRPQPPVAACVCNACASSDECELPKALQEKACSTADKVPHGRHAAVPGSRNSV